MGAYWAVSESYSLNLFYEVKDFDYDKKTYEARNSKLKISEEQSMVGLTLRYSEIEAPKLKAEANLVMTKKLSLLFFLPIALLAGSPLSRKRGPTTVRFFSQMTPAQPWAKVYT